MRKMGEKKRHVDSVHDRVSRIERPLVLYHGPGCRDGFCAAYLAHLRFPGADLVLQEYGDPFTFDEVGAQVRLRVEGRERRFDLAGRDVLMLDWSPSNRNDPDFGRSVLDGVAGRARSLLVLDHHEKQAPVLSGRYDAVFDVARSGCGIALDAFFPEAREHAEAYLGFARKLRENPHELIASLTYAETLEKLPGRSTDVAALALVCEAWDLWKKNRYEGVDDVCAAIDTLPRAVEAWGGMHSLTELACEGAAVLAYQRQQVECVVKHAREVTWTDLGIVSVVNSPILQSEVGEALYEQKPKRASAVWYACESGDVIVSLRSKEGAGPDVGDAAVKRGGGGHKHSAGFKVSSAEFADPAVRRAFGVGQ